MPPTTPGPVNTRDRWCPPRRSSPQAYLAAFREQFLHIQGDYRKRRRAFDTLFKHCPYDPAGSFAYRWECVLRRLDQTDADALVEALRKRIAVLNPSPAHTARVTEPTTLTAAEPAGAQSQPAEQASIKALAPATANGRE